MGEMPQNPKAAGERHLGDRHVRRLLQYLPGVLEPDIFQILHRRFPPAICGNSKTGFWR